LRDFAVGLARSKRLKSQGFGRSRGQIPYAAEQRTFWIVVGKALRRSGDLAAGEGNLFSLGLHLHNRLRPKIEVFEAGTSLLTLLAYSRSKYCQNKRDFIRTFARWLERAIGPPAIKPVYAFRSEREIKTDLRSLYRRHRHPMITGRDGYRLAPESTRTLKVPGAAGWLSINACRN
jgi:hypothetical protein